jgi:UDPglucose--hexose-1-phosphate uridylyltransferase
MSEFRQNPISKHWVLIAPNRAKRPEQFSGSAVMEPDLPEIDSKCPFCPGNESMNAEIGKIPNNKNWQVRIIPNKYEALSHQPFTEKNEFYISRSGSGDHEVLITRKHNEPVALQSIRTVELTLQVFKQRLIDLSAHKDLSYAQIFHNHGRDAGASLIHPHYQIISTPMVPTGLRDEIMGCYDYYRHNGKCPYCAIVAEERKRKERMVFETEDFAVFSPYAARSPFETWVVPKEHSARFEKISNHQIEQLAYVLKVILSKIYIKLSDPALNFYLHTLPFEHAKHSAHTDETYHWHFTVFPRLSIWAGFEYGTGIPVNPVIPEAAAEFLRD